MLPLSEPGSRASGLTCAYRLARAGHQVTIYEKSAELGGLAGSFQCGEFIFDYGPHEFCTKNPLLVTALEDILGDDLVVREKHAAQFFNGKYVDYPLAPLDVLEQLSPSLALRVGFEVIGRRLKAMVNSLSDHSFEQWVASRFGPTLYRMYFQTLYQEGVGDQPRCP